MVIGLFDIKCNNKKQFQNNNDRTQKPPYDTSMLGFKNLFAHSAISVIDD